MRTILSHQKGGPMDNPRLASLRKEFRVLLKEHDSVSFRHHVNDVVHCEHLSEFYHHYCSDEEWQVVLKAEDILMRVSDINGYLEMMDGVFAWSRKLDSTTDTWVSHRANAGG